MEYIVIDEMCCTETKFNNFKEAKKYALNIQGVLYRIDKNKEKEFLLSYAD